MFFGRIALSSRCHERLVQHHATRNIATPGRPSLSAMALASALATTLFLSACGSAAPVAPGFYRVQRGDTLSDIARKQGVSTTALARWNSLSNPNQIDVNQVLRVTPPAGGDLRTESASANVVSSSSSASRRPPAQQAQAASATPRTARRAAAAAAVTPVPAPSGPPASRTIALAWPAGGAVVARFDGSRSKGIDIAANLGDPVVAAASGEIAYVGQLRGYGNLLIIKHSNGFLTSYGHLQGFDVREGQTVASGKQIATVGATESTRPLLHFELRYDGRPVDPMRYLPPR